MYIYYKKAKFADFGIPRLAGEWSYGILMTSVALPDDLCLTGQYVNKSK